MAVAKVIYVAKAETRRVLVVIVHYPIHFLRLDYRTPREDGQWHLEVWEGKVNLFIVYILIVQRKAANPWRSACHIVFKLTRLCLCHS